MKIKEIIKTICDYWPPLCAILFLVIYSIFYKVNIHDKIDSDYQITSGPITGIGYHGRRYYMFFVNGKWYHGVAHGSRDEEGDRIQIRYYVPDPSLNRWEDPSSE